MNSLRINDLKAEITRQDLTVPKLAKAIKIDKNTLYRRLNDGSEFKQNEIVNISRVLKLSSDKVLSIFFADFVS